MAPKDYFRNSLYKLGKAKCANKVLLQVWQYCDIKKRNMIEITICVHTINGVIIKVWQEFKCYFCILPDILSDIGSILIKYNVFCPGKLEKFNETNIFQVSRIFPGF